MSRNYHVKDNNCANCENLIVTGDDIVVSKCKLPDGPEWATDTINFLWPWEYPNEQVCPEWQANSEEAE